MQPLSTNPYIYGGDDPVSMWDPTGLAPMCDGPCSSYASHKGKDRPPGLTLGATPPSRRAIWRQEMSMMFGDYPIAQQCADPVYGDTTAAAQRFGYCRAHLAPMSGRHNVSDAFAGAFLGPCYRDVSGACGVNWSALVFAAEWWAGGKVLSFGGRLLGKGVSALFRRGAARAAYGSIDEVLGALRVGRSPRVRVVDGVDELDDLFNRLSSGGQVIDDAAWGKLIRLPDGTTVGIRSTSRSGGPAIDIIQPGRGRQVVHVDSWNQ